MSLNYGGMERLLSDLVRLLPLDGFDNHLIFLDYPGHFSAGLEAHATIHEVHHRSPLSLFRPVELAALFDRIRPDIVHSHSGVWLKSARAARLARVPAVIHTEHGRPVRESLIDRILDRLASQMTDCVVAVSDTIEAVLRRRVLAPAARVKIIINGVDTRRFQPAAEGRRFRWSLNLGSNDLVIGSVGRLEPIKNYSLSIDAFAKLLRLRPTAPRVILVLVGDGSQRAALESQAERLGVSDSVRFLGWNAKIEEVLQGLDLFTLSSHSEGTSISLLEAMSTGLCAVVTDVGGNRAVLGPDLDDQLVPPGNADALALAWKRFLDDRTQRTLRGRRSRERIVTGFSIERMVNDYAELYRELAASLGRFSEKIEPGRRGQPIDSC